MLQLSFPLGEFYFLRGRGRHIGPHTLPAARSGQPQLATYCYHRQKARVLPFPSPREQTASFLLAICTGNVRVTPLTVSSGLKHSSGLKSEPGSCTF